MIDLREQYGKRYKVVRCEPGEVWCYEIIGKRGYIRPYGDELEMYLTSSIMCGRAEKQPGFKAKNHYDDATAFVFANTPELVAIAAKWVKARNRKQYTPEQRMAMASRMRSLHPKLKQRSTSGV